MKRIIPFSRCSLFLGLAVLLTGVVLPAGALDFKGRAPSINNLIYQADQEILVDEVFSLRHKGDAVSFFVTFSAGASGTTGNRHMTGDSGGLLYYNLFLSAAQRTILRDITDNPLSSQVITGSFTAEEGLRGGTTKDYSLSFIIDQNQFPLAGVYGDYTRGPRKPPFPAGRWHPCPSACPCRWGR